MGCCITKKKKNFINTIALESVDKNHQKINSNELISRTDLLYIIITYYNPAGFARRLQLHQEFCSRLLSHPRIVIITVECAYENQDFQVTVPNHIPEHIQIRSNSCLWHKECLMNIALSHLKANKKFLDDCKYVAWVDNDIEFSDRFFIEKMESALQKYTVVQMFKQAYFLDINRNLIETFISFGYYYVAQNLILSSNQYAHPGYAWATTKTKILEMNEFYDMGIMGNGDKHMAAAMIGNYKEGFVSNYPMTEGYMDSLKQWQDKVSGIFQKKLGYVDMEIRHHWHGSIDDRQYMWRWKLLMDFKYFFVFIILLEILYMNENCISYRFDPLKDLEKRNGIYKLKSHQKHLENKIIEVFKDRNEDKTINIEYIDEKIPQEPKKIENLTNFFEKNKKKIEKNSEIKIKNNKSFKEDKAYINQKEKVDYYYEDNIEKKNIFKHDSNKTEKTNNYYEDNINKKNDNSQKQEKNQVLHEEIQYKKNDNSQKQTKTQFLHEEINKKSEENIKIEKKQDFIENFKNEKNDENIKLEKKRFVNYFMEDITEQNRNKSQEKKQNEMFPKEKKQNYEKKQKKIEKKQKKESSSSRSSLY